jgi:hypothetical protein
MDVLGVTEVAEGATHRNVTSIASTVFMFLRQLTRRALMRNQGRATRCGEYRLIAATLRGDSLVMLLG